MYLAFFLPWRNNHSRSRPSRCRGFTITLRHTTLGSTPLDEWSARRRDLYLNTFNTQKRQTSIPPRDSNPQSRQASGNWNRHVFDAENWSCFMCRLLIKPSSGTHVDGLIKSRHTWLFDGYLLILDCSWLNVTSWSSMWERRYSSIHSYPRLCVQCVIGFALYLLYFLVKERTCRKEAQTGNDSVPFYQFL